MTNENNVDILLFELVNIDVFILRPWSGHKCLDINLWVSLSDDYLLFFFDWGLFNLGDWFFLDGFLSFFCFFVHFEVMTGLFFLNVVHLYVIEFFSETISIFSVSVHNIIEDI